MNLFDEYPEKLSAEKEEDICSKIFRKDTSANEAGIFREALVLHSMREAYAYAAHFGRGQFSEREVVSLAFIALRKAAKNFKPGHCRFFAYAKPYVRGEVFRAHRANDVVKNAIREPIPSSDTCHPETGVSIAEDESRRQMWGGTCEMDFDAIHFKEVWAKVEPLIETLTEKEQQVVRAFLAGQNFREMGDDDHVSRAAKQNTFTRAIAKLGKALKNLK